MGTLTKLLAKDGEGERLDRFELIAELASGGMATVFLARLSGVAGFQRLVAIKRLHPHLAREAEFVEMFLDEARLAARIHHPNVVPIQEVGQSEHGFYLVMDYIEGDTLAHVLARASKGSGTVPYGVTIRILLDVLAGLHAAHEMKDDYGVPLEIVHRDVSPQNILVGADGVSRVVDFGVARAASRLSTTRSGQLKGKLAYMAPEQARGGALDRRADLFACGIVLWEALATKRLFKGDGEAETLNRVLYEPIPSPSSARPDVPLDLEMVCMKALSRDPEQRFATAQDFADELERAARQLGSVGSVRDVAACLQDVIGADLSQQRDAVRAWLARSEPSHGTGPRSRPVLDSTVTKIEGSTRPVDPGALTAAAPLEGRGPPSGSVSFSREALSTVSSAVVQLQSGSGPISTGAPGSSPARTGGRIALALLLAVVLVGAGALGAKKLGSRTNAAATHVAPATSVLPAPAVSLAPPPVEVTAPAPTVELTAEPPAASASASARKPYVRPSSRSGGRTSNKPPAGGVPDDLNNNPYR